MPEITVNLIHDLKMKRLQRTKPPFIGGLRTGYVRAWVFVVFKVWLLVALMNGVSTMTKLEENITLLDSYIRNDFSRPEIFFHDKNADLAFLHISHTEASGVLPELLLSQEAEDQHLGIVASDHTTIDQPIVQPAVAPADSATGQQNDQPVLFASANSISTPTAIPTTTQNVAHDGATQETIMHQYIQQTVGEAIADAIRYGFVLGNGTPLVGCLQVNVGGVLHGVGHKCSNGGGGSTTIIGGSGTMAVGDSITGATSGSVLFAGVSGALTQDNTNFFWDNSTKRLGIGDSTPLAALTVGASDAFQVDSTGAISAATGITSSGAVTFAGLSGGGIQCLQVSNTGLLSGTGSACGSGGGSGADTALSNLSAVAINTSLLLGVSDGGALGSTTKMWSDLFLASGAVINFNNGDVTLTHTVDTLTLGGGDLIVTAAGNAAGSVLTTNAIQTVTNKNLTSGTNTFPTFNQNTTGSAATLTTPRGIYGNNFDGSAALTQVIASTYGGTGNGFTKFSGPATTEKTFTLPNASAAILTDNAAVTVAQGGTGAATLTGLLLGNGTSPFTATAVSSGISGALSDETGSGALVFATSPTLVTPVLGVASATSLSLAGTLTGATGITSSGTITFSGLGGGGSQCLQVSNTGVLSGTGAGCGAGAGTVTSVSGTTNRITVATGTTTPVIDISSSYVGQASINTLGTIGTGVWQGTAVGATYGGTGINSSASTGVPSIASGTWSVNAQLPVSLGGSGVGSFTTNGVLYGNSTSALQATTQGGANTVLVANNGAPSFSSAITVGTSVTSPIFIGGTTTTSPLTLRSTSGSGIAGADIIFQTGNNGATEAMRILNSGNVGIGDATPASLLTVGSGDAFQVNSSGAIAAATGITSSGTITLSGLGGGGTQCVQTNNTGILSTAVCANAYWSRSGAILQPVNAGDAITTSGNISTSGSGTITSAGLLTGSAGLTVTGGTINLTSTGASTYTVPTNTAASFRVTDGTNPYLTIDTRSTTSGVSGYTFAQKAPQITAASGAQFIGATFTPGTFQMAGGTNVTGTGTGSNVGVLLNQLTVSNNSNPGITVTEASNMIINGPAKAANTNSDTTTITTSYGLNILAGAALNGTGSAVTKGVGLSVNAPTGAAANYAALFNGGNVGIGNTAPASLFSVGSSSQFQVNSAGAVAAATGITSSGTVTLSGLGGGGTQCVQTSNTGVLSAAACAGAGSTYVNSLLGANNSNYMDNGSFSQQWDWDALANGYGLSLYSGSTAASSSPSILGVTMVGANVNSSQTTIGATFNNFHSGTTSSNYAATFTSAGGTNNTGAQFSATGSATLNTAARFIATGATDNYAGIFTGKVGINNTTPTYDLDVGGTAHVGSLGIGSGGISTWSGLNVIPTLTGANSAYYGIYNSSNASLSTSVNNYYGEKIDMFSYGDGSNTDAAGLAISFTGGTYANAYGIIVPALSSGTNNAGLLIGGATGTKHTNLLIDATLPVGAYSIYNGSTAQNYFNGKLGIKATSPATDIEIGSYDTGVAAQGPTLTIGNNTNATAPTAGTINFKNMSGTSGYVWQDSAGNMRINNVFPTWVGDTSGTVIGTQTSTRSTKQDITNYTDVAQALQTVTSAPLHTFRYIKDVEGYGTNSPLAKTRIGFIADEVSSQFMWGNTIDQVSVNGLLMASVKALNNKVISLTTQLNAQQDYPDLVMGQPASAGTPIVLASQLYLTGDNIGQAKILAGETSVRISFSKAYQYQPIVTTTPNGKVGSEYWVSDKDSMGFTINIELPAAEAITFDWHSFAGESAKLTVSDGSSSDIILVAGEDAPIVAPAPPLDPDLSPAPPTVSDPQTPPVPTEPTTSIINPPVVASETPTETNDLPTPPVSEPIEPRGPPAS
jgi:hypothetical protein